MRNLLLLVLLTFLLFTQCMIDPPGRTNPLDPLAVGNAEILGRIINYYNSPISEFYIVIAEKNESYIYQFINNANGEYKFVKTPGYYDIWVWPENFPTTNEYFEANRLNVELKAEEPKTENIKVFQMITSPSPGSTIFTTTPSMIGKSYPGAATYLVDVYRDNGGTWTNLWGIYNITDLSSLPYPSGAPFFELPLITGRRHRIEITAYDVSFDSWDWDYADKHQLAYSESIIYVQ